MLFRRMIVAVAVVALAAGTAVAAPTRGGTLTIGLDRGAPDA